MIAAAPRPILIVAALIDDGAGRLLLVRKVGTAWFMQAGGKIEVGENPAVALRRELIEEIGLGLYDGEARLLGHYAAPAANWVDAHVFHVRTRRDPVPGAEIADAVWVDRAAAAALPLAPLTRDHILPLALTV